MASREVSGPCQRRQDVKVFSQQRDSEIKSLPARLNHLIRRLSAKCPALRGAKLQLASPRLNGELLLLLPKTPNAGQVTVHGRQLYKQAKLHANKTLVPLAQASLNLRSAVSRMLVSCNNSNNQSARRRKHKYRQFSLHNYLATHRR